MSTPDKYGERYADSDIAIIGLAGKFPGAENLETFWDNINNRVESISFFDEDELLRSGISSTLLHQKNYIRAKGYLEDAALFDAKFFKFTPQEATSLDPQFRLFIEMAWEALENAAYLSDDYNGKISVFASSSTYDCYYVNNLLNHSSVNSPSQNLSLLTLNAKDFLANWVAYKLNLNGPCVNVQTACSSSLVAICMACDSLLNQNCEIALAGGISITTPLKAGYLYQPGMILSEDGHCRPFDSKATGCVTGNGGGILVLKRLTDAIKDHDFIHAIIKGYSINNDGNNKIGYTAPSIEGQSKVISAAMKMARVTPQEISYIETHGTGTHLGDAIEFNGLCEAYGQYSLKKQSIALGTVKSNIGHLDVAAGVASTIKMVQALKYQILPPMVHFSQPNSNIQLANSPFFINSESLPWKSKSPRITGISSFGMGGTNAHLIMQEFIPSLPKRKNKQPVLLILSALNLSALIRLRRGLSQYLIEHPDVNLTAVAYSLQVGRKFFEKRFACICCSIEEAVDNLNQLNELILLKHDIFNKEIDFLRTAAQAWLAGNTVDWRSCYSTEEQLYRIPLPTYPFERREFWISPKNEDVESPLSSSINKEKLTKGKIETLVISIFRNFFGVDKINSADNFFDFGGDSLLSLQLLAEIEKQLHITVSLDMLENYTSINGLTNLLYEKYKERNIK